MALTPKERETLYGIKEDVAILRAETKGLKDTHEKIKVQVGTHDTTLYRNGLSSKVDAIHDWMNEQKASAVKISGEQKILGIEFSNNAKLALIGGGITIVNAFVTYYLK